MSILTLKIWNIKDQTYFPHPLLIIFQAKQLSPKIGAVMTVWVLKSQQNKEYYNILIYHMPLKLSFFQINITYHLHCLFEHCQLKKGSKKFMSKSSKCVFSYFNKNFLRHILDRHLNFIIEEISTDICCRIPPWT